MVLNLPENAANSSAMALKAHTVAAHDAALLVAGRDVAKGEHEQGKRRKLQRLLLPARGPLRPPRR
jgi:hypothetical protein